MAAFKPTSRIIFHFPAGGHYLPACGLCKIRTPGGLCFVFPIVFGSPLIADFAALYEIPL